MKHHQARYLGEVSRKHRLPTRPELDQYFLSNATKARRLIAAARLSPDDRVVELGAGIGSFARHLPACRCLTLVELDPELARLLRDRFPQVRIIQADALSALPSLEFDVLFGNLPFFLTVPIVNILKDMQFRAAVMSVRADEELVTAAPLRVTDVAVLDEDDFCPRQPFKSKAVLIRPSPPRPGN